MKRLASCCNCGHSWRTSHEEGEDQCLALIAESTNNPRIVPVARSARNAARAALDATKGEADD